MEPRDTHSNFFQGRVSKELKHRRDEEERREKTQNMEGVAQPQSIWSLFQEAGTSRTFLGTNLDYYQRIE